MSNDERPQNKSNPQTPSAGGQKQAIGGQKSQHPTINVLGKKFALDPALKLSKDPNLPKLVFFKYLDPDQAQRPQVIAGLKKDIADLNKTIKTLEGRIAVRSAGGRKTPPGFQSRLGELKKELSATKQALTKETEKPMPQDLLLGIDSSMHLKGPEDKLDSASAEPATSTAKSAPDSASAGPASAKLTSASKTNKHQQSQHQQGQHYRIDMASLQGKNWLPQKNNKPKPQKRNQGSVLWHLGTMTAKAFLFRQNNQPAIT